MPDRVIAGQLAENGATLSLGGSFTTAGVGALARVGGTIDLAGTLNNAGATLTLDASSGPWNLRGGQSQRRCSLSFICLESGEKRPRIGRWHAYSDFLAVT